MAQGRSLGEELLDLHNSLQRLELALSKAFIYMFFKQGLPKGSKLRFHRRFHEDPELEAIGNGMATLALQSILPNACREYHLSAQDTCAYWEALVKVIKDGEEPVKMLLSGDDDVLTMLWQKLDRFGHVFRTTCMYADAAGLMPEEVPIDDAWSTMLKVVESLMENDDKHYRLLHGLPER